MREPVWQVIDELVLDLRHVTTADVISYVRKPNWPNEPNEFDNDATFCGADIIWLELDVKIDNHF